MKPTTEVYKAIDHLKSDPQWKIFYEWLRREHIDAAIASCNFGVEPGRSWIQGHAQLLEMEIAVIDETENALKAAEKDTEKDKSMFAAF